ncbi:MAG: VanW family protein [Treponema sp.]|nr:VanW family protein [Treponema sp.]
MFRRLAWIRWKRRFAIFKHLSSPEELPFTAFTAIEHAVPLRRNLSKTDTALQEGKIANLELAVKKVSGTLLESGKIFSYWHLIGNPTKRKGYKKGMMLVNGKPTAAIGGGLCALSNLIYWMTLHTPLTVIERYRHSYDVFPDSNRTQPFGSGATCVYNYRDLMIENRTCDTYILFVWIDHEKGLLCGKWVKNTPITDSYEVYQKEHWITAEIGGIYVRHNTIWRKHYTLDNQETITDTKTLYNDEYITENHAIMMYEPLLETKKR